MVEAISIGTEDIMAAQLRYQIAAEIDDGA